jgi:hypothetical protein
MPALAALECAIRHEQNRTPTPQKAEFLPSLDGQITKQRVQPLPQKYSYFFPTQITGISSAIPPDQRGVSRSSRT